MAYLALYRKYRPDSFENVKGQEHIVTTIKNQVVKGRMAHAYLFCGSRGTGKTSIAKLFAKAVNCLNPMDGSPCGECPNCRNITSGASMSVVEIDAASNNGVDNVRQITEEVAFSPGDGCRYRVYIIDEVHMLSTGAFNALLKTLEEPPEYCIFILATTDPQKVPVTILSRCQRYDFRRIPLDVISDRLEEICGLENINAEPRALRYIARMADGGMRDALSLLDQCAAFGGADEKGILNLELVQSVLGTVDTKVFSDMLKSVSNQNVSDCISILSKAISEGKDTGQFLMDFINYLRNLLIVKTTIEPEGILDMSEENIEQLRSQAENLDADRIIRYIRVLSDAFNNMRYSSTKRIQTEIALIRLCKPQMENDGLSLKNRIANLENMLESEEYIGRIVQMVKAGIGNIAIQAPVETPKRQLPEALPEDVQLLVNKWGSLKKEAYRGGEGSMLTGILAGAYPSIDDGRLKIIVKSSVHKEFLMKEGGSQLSLLIEKLTNKRMDFTVEVDSAGGAGSEYPDIRAMAIAPDLIVETSNTAQEVEGFE